MVSDTLDALLKLPAGERAELALAHWESLTDADREAESTLSDGQKAELDRRLVEHDADPESAIPWEVVQQRHKELR